MELCKAPPSDEAVADALHTEHWESLGIDVELRNGWDAGRLLRASRQSVAISLDTRFGEGARAMDIAPHNCSDGENVEHSATAELPISIRNRGVSSE